MPQPLSNNPFLLVDAHTAYNTCLQLEHAPFIDDWEGSFILVCMCEALYSSDTFIHSPIPPSHTPTGQEYMTIDINE